MTIKSKMHKSIAALIVFSVVLFAAGCENFGTDDQQMLATAKEYMDSGKINAAVIELHNALQENPESGEARYLLGTINLEIGDYATAEKEFRRALKAGWQEEAALTGLARALLGQDDYTRLLDDVVVKEVWAESVRANLLGSRAIALAGLSHADQAEIVLAEAAKLDADSLQVMRASIQLKLIAGKEAAAREALAIAMEKYPDARDLQLMAARVARSEGQDKSAGEIFQRVIAADPPGFVSAYGRSARFGLLELQVLGADMGKAETTLRALYKISPNDPYTNYLGGLLAFRQGDYEKAEGRLLLVLKFAPDHNPTRLLYGVVNYAQHDYEQAAYFLSKYVTAVPENLDARKLLVRSYLALERQDDALEVSQSGLTENSSDAELVALAGLSEVRRGKTAAGIAELEKAVSMAPDSLAMRGELAKAYMTAGETDLAVKQLQEILNKGGYNKQAESMMVLAHMRAGEFDQAGIVALGMLSKDKDDPAVITLVGNVFAASGDRHEAREYLERALRVKPGFSPAALSLARVEELEGNTERARELYEGQIDSATNPVVPMLALARLAKQQGRVQEMIEWLNKAIARAPAKIESRVFLASYYLREKQPDKAKPLVAEALKHSPKAPELLMLQGRLLMGDRRFEEALPSFSLVLSSDPGFDVARLLRGERLLQLGRLKEARTDLDILLKKQPNNIVALVLMTKLEIQEGKFDQALDHSMQIQQEFPEQFTGYELTGDARFAQQDYAGAEQAYAQALDRMKNPELAIKLAESLYHSGNPEEAITQLQTWSREYPDHVSARQRLGTIYLDMGRNSEAAEAYHGVLAIDQNNRVALNNLAWLYMQSNNPEALAMAKRAYLLYPDDPGVLDTYGWLLVQHDQADEGRRLLKQAMEKLADLPEVHYHYAMALYKTGDKKEGLSIFQQLLNSDRPFEGMDEAKRILMSSN